ncbi:MAG: hypothetical protein WA791_10270 [Rhodomicrobium sp.]
MRDWRLPFWLAVAGVYALYSAFSWGKWPNLALWTRVHASIDVGTGISMLLGAAGLMLAARTGLRTVALISGSAAALLGVSRIAGALLGTLPCTGGS